MLMHTRHTPQYDFRTLDILFRHISPYSWSMSSFNSKKRPGDDISQSKVKSKQKFDKKAAKKEADRFISKGCDLQESGDYDGARRQYEKALSSYENYSEGLYNLASLNAEILENHAKHPSRVQLAVETVGYLHTIIASDTSKRGETTGLAHYMLANVLVDCKDVLLPTYKHNNTAYFSSIEENFTSAISILQTSKERDVYILEYSQYLQSKLEDVLSVVHAPDSSVTTLIDFLRNALQHIQRVLDVLSSALQTSFSSGIDNEVLSLRGDVLSDAWDCTMRLLCQVCSCGSKDRHGLNGFSESGVNQLHNFLLNCPSGAEVFARLQALAVDTHKTCASLEALLLSSQDSSSPAAATHLIVDLTLSLLTWHRLNGNVAEFVGRCRYFAEAQSSLLTALQRRRTDHLSSAVSSTASAHKHFAYLVDVVSTLGDSLASLATEMLCVERCELVFRERMWAELASNGLVSALEQSRSVLKVLANDFSVSCATHGSAHEASCSSGTVLSLSHECYAVSLAVWSSSGGRDSLAPPRIPPHESDGGLFSGILQSGLCDEAQFAQLLQLYADTSSVQAAWSDAQKNSTAGTDDDEEEEDADPVSGLRDMLYNMSCVLWRLGDERACCEALLRYLVLDRLVRRRDGTLLGGQDASILRDLKQEVDLVGVENTSWLIALCNLQHL